MTHEEFIAKFGREPTEVEEKWLRLIVPIKALVSGKIQWVPYCAAFCLTDLDHKDYPIPDEWQEIVYGQLVPGLTLAQFSITNKALEDFVRSLKAMGLKGIEVYYPDHSPAQTAYYTELANHFDLLMTGGTDFHGSLKPDLKMGTGRGNLFIPYDLYERLIQSG